MWSRRSCLHVMVAAAAAAGLGPAALAQASGAGGESPSTVRFWREGDPGERLHLRGRVVSASGRPVAGAEILLRQADGTGAYQDDRYRGRIVTAGDGSFQVVTVLPGQYWGAKHIHLTVSHPDHAWLDTRILFRGDPNIDETEGDLAIPLEEVRTDEGTVLLGGVELVLE